MTTPPKWLTPMSAAAHLCLSKQRLARLRLSGTGPEYLKIGRTVLYDLNLLDEWMATRRTRSTSQRHSRSGKRVKKATGRGA
jgi:hypothetical protein